jgi:hypothetical protein
MVNIQPELECRGLNDWSGITVSEKLCQWTGSAVRSLILHHSTALTTERVAGEQQVSTFEARGVSSMF